MQTPYPRLERAKSLLLATSFAFAATVTSVRADNSFSVVGLADATRAAGELSTHQKVRLFVYQPADGPLQSAAFFAVGGFTFGYSRELGSKYVTARLNDSPSRLAAVWCHQPILFAKEHSIPKSHDLSGQCANGCLVDSLVHYYQLPSTVAEANWEGIFLLFSGPTEVGGDHAVLVYLRGDMGWVYDPCGCRTLCLGKIDLNRPIALAHQIQPDASTGGWLVSRDLAWLRRHGVAFN